MACAQRAPCLTASVFLPVLAFGGALPGCATRQVLEDNESLLNYGIHRHSVIHHKAVRQRTYSDVDYAELSRFTEDMQRKKRYGVPCHGCHMHTRSTASPQHATVYHRLYCLICPPPLPSAPLIVLAVFAYVGAEAATLTQQTTRRTGTRRGARETSGSSTLQVRLGPARAGHGGAQYAATAARWGHSHATVG